MVELFSVYKTVPIMSIEERNSVGRGYRMTANQLRLWRLKLGFRQQELAALAGVSPALIVAVERYQHLPGEDVRARIAKALGVSQTTIWPEVIDVQQ